MIYVFALLLAGSPESINLPIEVFNVCSGIEDEDAARLDIGARYDAAQSRLEAHARELKLDSDIQIDDVCDL